jgi:FkbM family methyltransferase
MASPLQKIRIALKRPATLREFIRWKLQRMVGIEPRIRIGGGGLIGSTAKFNDFIGFHAQHPGDTEFSTVKHLLGKGGTFVDVGANIGQMCVLAYKTGLAPRIIAFEPTPQLAAAWMRNIAFNGVDAATRFQAACSDEPGVIEFMVNWPMNNRINAGESATRYKPDDARFTRKVGCVTLDGALAATGISQVQLLKIDVEGAEVKVLRGAKSLLSRKAISAIYLECIPEFLLQMGDSAGVLADFLMGYGYIFHSIEDDGRVGRILSREDIAQRRYPGLNVVAMPE